MGPQNSVHCNVRTIRPKWLLLNKELQCKPTFACILNSAKSGVVTDLIKKIIQQEMHTEHPMIRKVYLPKISLALP